MLNQVKKDFPGERKKLSMLKQIFEKIPEKIMIPGQFLIRPLAVQSYNHIVFGQFHHLELGIRIPVGLSYQFESGPFEAFLELVPVFNLLPQTRLDFDGGIGVRYYF